MMISELVEVISTQKFNLKLSPRNDRTPKVPLAIESIIETDEMPPAANT